MVPKRPGSVTHLITLYKAKGSLGSQRGPLPAWNLRPDTCAFHRALVFTVPYLVSVKPTQLPSISISQRRQTPREDMACPGLHS